MRAPECIAYSAHDCPSLFRISFVDSVWLECELLSATDTHYTITLKDAPQQTGVSWKGCRQEFDWLEKDTRRESSLLS